MDNLGGYDFQGQFYAPIVGTIDPLIYEQQQALWSGFNLGLFELGGAFGVNSFYTDLATSIATGGIF